MSRTPVVLLVLSLLVLVACSDSRPEPAPPQPTSEPVAVVEPTPTTVLDAIIVRSTLTSEPYPAPVALATVVSYPAYPEPPLATPVPVTPLPTEGPLVPPLLSDDDPTCRPDEGWVRCTDEFLQLTFEYPEAWGSVDATLRGGPETGLLYDYEFPALNTEPSPVAWVIAGGRSRDFAIGRDGVPTDFWGHDQAFGGCEGYASSPLVARCSEVAPGVLLTLLVPRANDICGGNSLAPRAPRVSVTVDLPSDRVVGGFRFWTSLLSERELAALEAAEMEILGTAGPGSWKADGCDRESEAAFDAMIDDLVTRLEAGQLDTQTQQHYARLQRLAASIAPAPGATIGTEIISDEDPHCSAQGAWVSCTDAVLEGSFEYPAEWGQIDALLREGREGGRAYQYYWSEHPDSNEAFRGQRYPLVGLDRVPISGGRSDDFREGRHSFLTDFFGYDETRGCATYEKSLLIVRCREVAPGVVLAHLLPTAEALCTRPDLYGPVPYQLVELDLPDSETVNGFRVLATFLSEPEWALLEAQAQLLTAPGVPSGRCTRGMRAAFDAYVDDLLRRIEAGELDEGTQRALEHFERFATSITFP